MSLCWAIYESDGKHIRTSYQIIFPEGFSIPASATAVHGITTAQAKQTGVPLIASLSALFSAIKDFAPSLYVGHNVDFDRSILLNEYLRCRTPENLSPLPFYCTMKRTTEFCRIPSPNRYGYKWPKLDELHRRLFRQPHAGAHNAAEDVAACAKCFFELKSRGHIRP